MKHTVLDFMMDIIEFFLMFFIVMAFLIFLLLPFIALSIALAK